jgi:Spy/CpxP family protein refolding chaperone
VLAGGLAACSHGGPHGSFASMSPEDVAKVRGKLADRVTRELQLDETQKQNLNVLFDRFEAQRKLLAAGDVNPRATMQALVAGEHFDRQKANALLVEKTEFARVAGPELIAAAADFYDSLRPDQQAKVRELMNRRHGWRG